MPFAGQWCKVWIYFGFVFAWTKGARPRFDTSTDMGLVLVPADAEVDSVIFRLRATDQDADFPLVFEITATITPVVRIDNLPCTLYNKVCQANVILTKRLIPGRLHDFAVRVRDTKGDSNSMQATISVTNATTPRDKIFPHIPSLVMVPEDTKPGKELDYLLVRANSWSGKPVYIELWQPKELFTIRQRQTPTQTRGVITLIGELDFETQSMYTLTMYATDPYTEPGKDTRNIAGLSVVVIVQDVQDVPPIFTLAPPLTRINNSVQPGDTIVRVHAEDGDKGVPREIVYGLVSEGNPFTPFFNISESSGEITLARPLEELTQITHVGAPVVLTVVAEEIRRSREEPPAQATVVDVGFLLGEPGNSPPYFENDNYVATVDENLEPGTVINFGDHYTTRVRDEDIGKAGVFALKLENNNGTFEINPTVAERIADFVITVRDNALIDYELHKALSFKITAQEVGPATNLSASVPVTIFLRDINDNWPMFEEKSYEVTLSENVTAGSRVLQVHATDKDTDAFSKVRYTNITGDGSEAFFLDPDTGLITVATGASLDREIAARLVLSVEARDENGSGNAGAAPLIVNLLDVNDNAPLFEKGTYEFMLNADLTNFTLPAFIKAIDNDAEPPNNIVRYEIVHGNYENKFYLNETSGELILRSPITKIRRKKQSTYDKTSKITGRDFVNSKEGPPKNIVHGMKSVDKDEFFTETRNKVNSVNTTEGIMMGVIKRRRKRAEEDALYILTARAYDLGVPHLSSITKIRILTGIAMEARIMMFVVPGEQPDSIKTAETLAAITGGRVTVLEVRPYVPQNYTGSAGTLSDRGKKSVIVARVEQTEPGTPLVDVEKIRKALAANGVGIISGTATIMNATYVNDTKESANEAPRMNVNTGRTTIINNTVTSVHGEEVTVYKAENKLLTWLLIILGLLMLLAVAILIVCCICPGCPFYMAPRKRRVHSSETLIVRSDGRPKRHLHRQPAQPFEVSWNGRKQAWSADPTRRNWQFNKRNVKNCSLPGDVAYIFGQTDGAPVHLNVDTQRLRNGPSYAHSRRSRMDEQDRIYMEDMEGQKARGYDTAEMESLQQHQVETGSDLQRQSYRRRSGPRYVEHEDGAAVREQHFYREGNAEVLRLVTRGQTEDLAPHVHRAHHHRPTTLIVDGKDIILQRFIEDQNSRHGLPGQDMDAPRSMESHQRPKEVAQQQQPEIILIPDRLELGHRQHIEEIGPNVQRLVIDHGDNESQSLQESQMKEDLRLGMQEAVGAAIPEGPSTTTKEHVQTHNAQYSFHDVELARQNALLTRLLLDRESRKAGGAAGVDSTSYLETQSLPGQVAIATQTDRSAATQTDRHVRSRSDNDESDDESRHKKKLKSRKKHGDGDWKKSRTLWMKSPIEEEGSPRFDKRLSILRKNAKEANEGRKISIEADVLREISDSLDGNGSSCKGEDDATVQGYRKSTEQTSITYKVLNEKEYGSLSSDEMLKGKRQKGSEDMTDDQKMNATESTSSPDAKVPREKRGNEKVGERSPQKEAKSKEQKKTDGQTKPSFKILEKEFTLLTKKLTKLGDKKFPVSTGSDSTSQEKSEPHVREPRRHSNQRSSKKVDASGSEKAIESAAGASKSELKGKRKEDSAVAKTKQKLKYQPSHVMSTGSSEYDDAMDKPKRSVAARQETAKSKKSVSGQSYPKVKQTAQTEKREARKHMAEFRDEGIQKRKDGVPKEVTKVESKVQKIERERIASRMVKPAAVVGRNGKGETSSTSISGDSGKGANFSEGDSNGSGGRHERGMVERKVSQRFSDDFVEAPRSESAQERTSMEGEQNVIKKEAAKRDETAKQMLSTAGAMLLTMGGLDQVKGLTGKFEEEFVKENSVVKDETEDSVIGLDNTLKRSEIPTVAGKLNEIGDIIRHQVMDYGVTKERTQKRENEKSIPTEMTKQDNEEKGNGEKKGDLSGTVRGIMKSVQESLENYAERIKSLGDSLPGDKSKLEDQQLEEKEDDKKVGESSEGLGEKAEESAGSKEEIGSKSELIENMKKADVEHETGMISAGKQEQSISKDINIEGINVSRVDKSPVTQAIQQDLKLKIPAQMAEGKASKPEESIEEFLKDDILNHSQDVTMKDALYESNRSRETSEICETGGQEKKRSNHDDMFPAAVSAKIDKEHKKETIVDDHKERRSELDEVAATREEGPTLKPESDDGEAQEQVILIDQEKYDELVENEEFRGNDQHPKNTVLDKDKVITGKESPTGETVAEEWEIMKEAIEGHKILEETSGGDKIPEEKAVIPKSVEEPSPSQNAVEEKSVNPKIADQLAQNDRSEKEQTRFPTVDGNKMKRYIVADEAEKSHEIDDGPVDTVHVMKEASEDSKSVAASIAGDKTVEEHTEVDRIVKDPTGREITVAEPICSNKVAEEVTDSTIIERAADGTNAEKIAIDHTYQIKRSVLNVDEGKNNIALNEEKTSHEKPVDIAENEIVDEKMSKDDRISPDKVEETVHTASESKEETAFPGKDDISTIMETAVKQSDTDLSKFAEKDQTIPNKKLDMHSEDKGHSSTERTIIDEEVIEADVSATGPEKVEIAAEAPEIRSDQTTKAEGTVKRMQPEPTISEKEIFTEEHKIEEMKKISEPGLIDGKNDQSLKIDVHRDMSNINEDNVTEDQKHWVRTSLNGEHKAEELNVKSEVKVMSADDTEKEKTQDSTTDETSKKGNVFSEMVKAVYSLVDKVTDSGGSRSTTSETGTVEHSPVHEKMSEKETSLLHPEDKDNNKLQLFPPSESTNLQIDVESLECIQSDEIKQEIEDRQRISKSSMNGRSIPHPKEESLQLNNSAKKEEKDEKGNADVEQVPKHATAAIIPVKSIEENKTTKSSTAGSSLSTKAARESSNDQKCTKDELSESSHGSDMKSGDDPDNKTMDKLTQATEKQSPESSTKESSNLQTTESLESPEQTTEVSAIEQPAAHPIASKSPTDSAGISGSEKTVEDGQTKLPEAKQFVKEETFTSNGIESQPLPVVQSHAEPDASAAVPRKECGEQDLGERKDGAVSIDEEASRDSERQEAVQEQYADVSLPLFSSGIDTVDDYDDSDSSSDISRKTTLTSRPYQTPRHHARELTEQDGVQAMTSDARNIDNEEWGTLTLELFDGKAAEASKTEETYETVQEKHLEESPLEKSVKRMDDGETASSKASSASVKAPSTGEQVSTATRVENARSKNPTKSKGKANVRVDERSSATHLQHAKSESDVKQQGKQTNKTLPSISKVARAESFKVLDRKAREPEKKWVLWQPKKKKSTSEESSEERATHPQDAAGRARYRTRKMGAEDQLKQGEAEQTRQSKRTEQEPRQKASTSMGDKDKKSSRGGEKHQILSKTGEIDTSKAQPKYMAWYKKNREEMEKKRAELMATDDEEQLPRWLRRSMRNQKSEKDEKQASMQKKEETTPKTRRKVKPLVNVESEQLKAIVRQGRKLRRAEGGKDEDPPVQIFATTPPAVLQTDPKHHLMQHSEYKYEKIPAPFYLHPPPVPHPSPQLSPQHFDVQASLDCGRMDDDFDSSVGVSLQGGNRLRHQQLLEKKSVFDIAYSEAAPSQLRSESTTPPS